MSEALDFIRYELTGYKPRRGLDRFLNGLLLIAIGFVVGAMVCHW